MLGWWYRNGWGWAIAQIGKEMSHIGKTFAVTILLKTLFSPWKQISTTSTFTTFFQTAIDNAISRSVGFVIRFSILFIALLWTIVVAVSGLALIILWPFIPLAIFIFPVLAAKGIVL